MPNNVLSVAIFVSKAVLYILFMYCISGQKLKGENLL